MTDADFDFAGYDHPYPDPMAPSRQVSAVVSRATKVAGAVASVALIVGAVIWGHDLAVREARGVPVIRAEEGPLRVTPSDPGGEIVDHQGFAVNTVAAVGAAAPIPDRLVLAPRPIELTEEDRAGGLTEPGAAVALDLPPGQAPDAAPAEAPVLAAAPPQESADPTELAIDAALAEALGETEVALVEEDPLSALSTNGVAEPTEAPDAGPVVRPRPRPAAVEALAQVDAPERVAAVEIDPATIKVGTRLVQFGAFDTPDQARTEWARLEELYAELMVGKAMVLQPAESGGRSFVRLRAHGFEDEADARRFCSAFTAQGNICIPVPQR